jgi:hypothetical protein
VLIGLPQTAQVDLVGFGCIACGHGERRVGAQGDVATYMSGQGDDPVRVRFQNGDDSGMCDELCNADDARPLGTPQEHAGMTFGGIILELLA